MKRMVPICLAVGILICALPAVGDDKGADARTTRESKGGKSLEGKSDKSASEEEKAQEPSVWMRNKLKSAENILGALATADFEAIHENAQRMNRFAQLERWARGGNADYQTQLRFFRHANEELMRQARNENLDGATLAFMQLTASCVHCHRAVRDTIAASSNTAKPAFDHVIVAEAAYYVGGPQQAQPPDGKFKKGTRVRMITEAGSYCLVETDDGVKAYVARDKVRSSRLESKKQ